MVIEVNIPVDQIVRFLERLRLVTGAPPTKHAVIASSSKGNKKYMNMKHL